MIEPVTVSTFVVTTSPASSVFGLLNDLFLKDPLERNPSDPFILTRLAKMCSSFSLNGVASVSSLPIDFSCQKEVEWLL